MPRGTLGVGIEHGQPRRPPAALPAPTTNAGVGTAFTRDVRVANSRAASCC